MGLGELLFGFGRKRGEKKHCQAATGSPEHSACLLAAAADRFAAFSRAGTQLLLLDASQAGSGGPEATQTPLSRRAGRRARLLLFPSPSSASSSSAEYTATIPPRHNSPCSHARHTLAHPPDLIAPAQAAGVARAPLSSPASSRAPP